MYTVLVLISAYNFWLAFSYIALLESRMRKGNYIYGDHMHSLQHIAITGMSSVLSVAMLFWVLSDYTMLIYIVYNASLTFIVYPHLTSEE